MDFTQTQMKTSSLSLSLPPYCIADDLEHVVVAMPHRGRTALQTILLQMRPVKVFHKLSGESEFPDGCQAMSDVISHFRKYFMNTFLFY